MAKEFPDVDVKAIDLVVPSVLGQATNLPPNFSFDQADASVEMDCYEETFDVVHARAAWGILDVHLWLYQAARSLRRKGVLLLGIALSVSHAHKEVVFPKS